MDAYECLVFLVTLDTMDNTVKNPPLFQSSLSGALWAISVLEGTLLHVFCRCNMFYHIKAQNVLWIVPKSTTCGHLGLGQVHKHIVLQVLYIWNISPSQGIHSSLLPVTTRGSTVQDLGLVWCLFQITVKCTFEFIHVTFRL